MPTYPDLGSDGTEHYPIRGIIAFTNKDSDIEFRKYLLHKSQPS
jgi:hypothetical protein